MITSDVRADIGRELDAIEAASAVRVLYACESGSRAWGFASADSDHDVRAVYVHPRDWYLSIDLDRRDDVIDRTTRGAATNAEIDVHAWNLPKALRLFQSSNPTLMDWLASPVVYREDEAVMERWREMRPAYYTPRRVWYAYRGMARSVAQGSLSGERVQHKAYLYVLRSLLAVRWVEQTASEPVPMAFDRLVASCIDDASLREAVDELLARKRSGRELEEGPRLPVIHDAIDAELARLDDAAPPAGRSANLVEPLNQFFRNVLDRQEAG